MRRFSIFFLSLVTCVLLGSASFAGTECTSTSNEASHQTTNAANGQLGYCFQTPVNMDVKIYEFGLCTAHSDPTNKSACTTLFENVAGKDMNLTVGSSLDLSDSVSLTEGTYSHAYVIMSNVTAIKTIVQFSNARTDDAGQSGVYCYTDGRSWNDNPLAIMSCGSSASDAVASEEKIGLEAPGGGYSSSELGYTVSMGGQSVITNLYMIDQNGSLSTSYNNDFAILGSQILSDQVIITPSTSSLDIAFSITDGVMVGFDIDFDQDNTTGTQTGPNDAVFEGLKFKITAK